MAKSLITCDCLGSFTIDREALARDTGLNVPPTCRNLCQNQIDKAAAAVQSGDAIICCTQEAQVFSELAQDLDLPAPPMMDLRDRAGWTSDAAATGPKMAALVAEAMLPPSPEKTTDVISEGLCLILGAADVAIPAADMLREYLAVTVLTDQCDTLPDSRDFDLVVGRLRKAHGAFGQFQVTIDALQTMQTGGQGALTLTEPQDGAISDCDLILDLRGEPPLFPAHEKRDGYLRADPAHPPSVAAAILQASHMVGTFEKPLYVRTDPLICAHSRAEKTACTRCLDLCPTGAISPAGDHVTIDPMICAGCGACSAACPSGAVSYDAPAVDHTMRRIQTLAKAYQDAGGTAPRLLVHEVHGAEMIRLAARYGQGLPADVIPLELPVTGAFGHAEAVAARAAGFASVSILPGPTADLDAMATQQELATAIAGETAFAILDIQDPDALSEALFTNPAIGDLPETPVRPMGSRRQITRLAARALHPDQEVINLPDGAPYGAVKINTDACTLCLSCVSLCPSAALSDNPDKPELRFQEDACLQCGLCAGICPEQAITYEPRLDLTPKALEQVVLHEEEPFACVECGVLFGVKSTIERISEKLQSHAMFADGDRLRMIQMCDDCRVNAQFHEENNPMAGPARRRPRTTADYFPKPDDA